MVNKKIKEAMKVKLTDIFPELPDYPEFDPAIRRAPKRELSLTEADPRWR